MTPSNNGIALRINYGGIRNFTQKSIDVGGVPEGFTATAPKKVQEERVWIIRHAHDYNAYECHIKDDVQLTYDGKGCVHLSLLIPSSKQLKDESPATVLREAEELFRKTAMGQGKLNPLERVDAHPFADFLSRYELEDRFNQQSLPEMKGTEAHTLCVSKQQLESIMRYSQYPIFSKISHLELGLSCTSSISLTEGKLLEPQKPEVPKKEERKAEQPGISHGLVGGPGGIAPPPPEGRKKGSGNPIGIGIGLGGASKPDKIGKGIDLTSGKTGTDGKEKDESEPTGDPTPPSHSTWIWILLIILGLALLVILGGVND